MCIRTSMSACVCFGRKAKSETNSICLFASCLRNKKTSDLKQAYHIQPLQAIRKALTPLRTDSDTRCLNPSPFAMGKHTVAIKQTGLWQTGHMKRESDPSPSWATSAAASGQGTEEPPQRLCSS